MRDGTDLAFIIDNVGIGGTELNAVRTAEGLIERGRRIVVFVMHGQGPLRERYEAAGARVVDIPIGGSISRLRAAARRYREVLRASNVQVVHAHDYYSNVFSALATPSCVYSIMSRRWWHSPSWRRRLMGRAAYSRADCVLGNSPSVGALLNREERVPLTRIRVVPNFVDDAAYVRYEEATTCRLKDELGLPPTTLVIGCVARLSPEKGHDVLLRALADARGSLTEPYCLVLIGEGPEESRLRLMVEELGLSGVVRFLGRRTAKPNLHLGLDVSVLCSYSEGFPNAVIEAMAASRAVIASRVGGVPDAIADGHDGLLFHPGHVRELAQHLTTLAESATMRERLGRQAFDTALQRYRKGVALDLLESLYDEALGKPA